MLDLDRLRMTGSVAVGLAIGNDPILLSADVAGKLELFDSIRVDPEPGDFQIIGGVPTVWDGRKWVVRDHRATYDPISFRPPGQDVWTVYPGWTAMKGQLVYCHRCFAASVSATGDMAGWWVKPHHREQLVCSICGGVISDLDSYTLAKPPAFIKKATR